MPLPTTQILELPVATSLSGTEYVPVVQSGVTKRAEVALFDVAGASGGPQDANTVFAGPASGGDAAPAFRALVAADIPATATIYIGASATGVDMDVIDDTPMTIVLPTGYTKYRVQAIGVYNATANLSTSTQVQFAVYAEEDAQGAVVLSPTACTITNNTADTNNNAQFVSATLTQAVLTDTTLFFRVTTRKGSAATASVAIQIQPFP